MMRECYWCNGIGRIFNYDRGEYGRWETCDVCDGDGEIEDPDLEDEAAEMEGADDAE